MTENNRNTIIPYFCSSSATYFQLQPLNIKKLVDYFFPDILDSSHNVFQQRYFCIT